MSGNLPIIVRNTMDGLGEGAQHLYLAMLDRYQGWNDRRGELAAFLIADDYQNRLGDVIDHILDNGRFQFPAVVENRDWKADLRRFFSERYRHNFLPAALRTFSHLPALEKDDG